MIRRSYFNLSHTKKLTCSMGKLVPVMCTEVVPGDKFRIKSNVLVRLAPMLAPVMGELSAFIHYWYVPTRLLQTNWSKMMSKGESGNEVIPVPKITPPSGGWPKNSLADYLGIPPENKTIPVTAYQFRAYNLIYNECYRDENLIEPVALSLADGSDTTTSTQLLSRAWQRDYFTNQLPWAQRGQAVTIPLAGQAPVTSNGQPFRVSSAAGGYGTDLRIDRDAQDTNKIHVLSNSVGTINPLYWSEETGLQADLSQVTGITVREQRLAFQLQKWAEKNARGGVRQVEWILAHFGIRISDARAQRPEFLGGGRAPIIVSEVLQTSSTDSVSPQANMAGTGFSAQQSPTITRYFEEHGYILAILSIMPRTSYQQGIPRQFLKDVPEDWYWPLFANIGEQATTIKELYAGASNPDKIFAFNQRYQEYCQELSTVHGDFRDTLNTWHFGRIFSSEPTLSADFINSDPTMRVFAITDGKYPPCLVHIGHDIKALRPIPKNRVPGFIDHDGWFGR